METLDYTGVNEYLGNCSNYLNKKSLSGIYKHLRKKASISNVGDYPLLSYILRTLHKHSPMHQWNKYQLLRVIHESKFYKDEGLKHAYIPQEWKIYVKN